MQELLQLSQEELNSKLQQARQASFAMAENVASGKEKNFAQLKELKAEVARIFTAMKTKQSN